MNKPVNKIPDCRSVPVALPSNKEALAVISRAVEKFLGILEPTAHNHGQRLEELQKTLDVPHNILLRAPFLAQITKADYERFAQGAPAVSVLIPFLDQARLTWLITRLDAAIKRIAIPAEPARPTLPQLKPSIEGYADFGGVLNEILDLFRDLQTRVLMALAAPEGPADLVQITVPAIAKIIFGAEQYAMRPKSKDRLIRKWIRGGKKLPATKVDRGLYSVSEAYLKILKAANALQAANACARSY